MMNWLIDIALGAILATTIVIFVVSFLTKKYNDFYKKDQINGQDYEALEVDMYFLEDDIAIPQSMAYADDAFYGFLKSGDFEDLQNGAIPENLNEKVSCYTIFETSSEDSEGPEDSSMQVFQPSPLPGSEDDGLDDMSRRLAPKKFLNPSLRENAPTPIDQIPTATRPIWEQPTNDDFKDFGDMM